MRELVCVVVDGGEEVFDLLGGGASVEEDVIKQACHYAPQHWTAPVDLGEKQGLCEWRGGGEVVNEERGRFVRISSEGRDVRGGKRKCVEREGRRVGVCVWRGKGGG